MDRGMRMRRRHALAAGAAGSLLAACGSGAGGSGGGTSLFGGSANYGNAGDVDAKTRYAEVTVTPATVKVLSTRDDAGRSQRLVRVRGTDGSELRAVFERGSSDPYLPAVVHDATSGRHLRFERIDASSVAIRVYDANGALVSGRLVWREGASWRMSTLTSATDVSRTNAVRDLTARLTEVRADVLRRCGIDLDPTATPTVGDAGSPLRRWLAALSPVRAAHAQADVETTVLQILWLMASIAASDDMSSFVVLPFLWILSILSGNFAFVTGGSRFAPMSATSADAAARGAFGPQGMPLDLQLRLDTAESGNCAPQAVSSSTTTIAPDATSGYSATIAGAPVRFQPPGTFRTQDARAVPGGTLTRDVTLVFQSDGTVSGTTTYTIAGASPCSGSISLTGAWRTVLRFGADGIRVSGTPASS